VVEIASRRSRSFKRAVRLDPPGCSRFFAPGTVWNTPLADDAPVDPDSAAVTDRLVRSVEAAERSDKPPWINTTRYAPPVYTVGPAQARVTVSLDRDAPELAEAFAAVPLPDDARPAEGTDSELVVWQPSSDTLWEFWGLGRENGRWRARWGGRLDQVSSGPGYFTGVHANWGATATGLPLAGGLITPRELESGQIHHALAIAAPEIRANEYALPAQRTDGKTYDDHAVPEGARFRLDPTLDVEALGLPRPIAGMARAAQRYGIIVRDRSATVTFYAQNPSSLRSNPYPAIFGGRTPAQLLRNFPWSRLQLMRMDLRRMPDAGPPPIRCLLGGCP
jgi:hypothetical protein